MVRLPLVNVGALPQPAVVAAYAHGPAPGIGPPRATPTVVTTSAPTTAAAAKTDLRLIPVPFPCTVRLGGRRPRWTAVHRGVGLAVPPAIPETRSGPRIAAPLRNFRHRDARPPVQLNRRRRRRRRRCWTVALPT